MQQNNNWNDFVRGVMDRCKENIRNYGKSVDYSAVPHEPTIIHAIERGKRVDKRSKGQ
jgi:hypothetical protein